MPSAVISPLKLIPLRSPMTSYLSKRHAYSSAFPYLIWQLAVWSSPSFLKLLLVSYSLHDSLSPGCPRLSLAIPFSLPHDPLCQLLKSLLNLHILAQVFCPIRDWSHFADWPLKADVLGLISRCIFSSTISLWKIWNMNSQSIPLSWYFCALSLMYKLPPKPYT